MNGKMDILLFSLSLRIIAISSFVAVAMICAGNVVAQDSPAELQRSSERSLEIMQKDHGYALKTGHSLRRVAPPFPPERLEFYRTNSQSQAKLIPAGPSAMIFHDHDGRLSRWGMTFGNGSGYTLLGLLDSLLKIKSQTIEGGEIIMRHVEGDWVVRMDTPKDQLIAELQRILQTELSMPIRIEWREIERPVYIARGTYNFTPLENGPMQRKWNRGDKVVMVDPIEIFAKELNSNGGGGGSGEFSEFLESLGQCVESPMISEAIVPEDKYISWHLNRRSPSTDQTRSEDHDPSLLLPNITAQTGLNFTREQRRVKPLFVEQTD